MNLPTLRSRRVTLRPIVMTDAPAIVDGLRHWDVQQWLSAPPFPYAMSDAHYFIQQVVPVGINWAIDAGDGLIGVVSVKPDLGYWLHEGFHGQGLMSEATATAVDWYFAQTADDLTSAHFLHNVASRAVLTKRGFVDSVRDTVVQTSTQELVTLQRMTLTRSAWIARHA